MTIRDELKELADLDDAELAQRYEQLHGRPVAGRSRRWLIGQLTMTLLRNACSGSSPDAKAVHDLVSLVDPRLADSLQRPRDPERLPPGATITGTWQGQRHVVTVLPRGCAWRGGRFLTLAEVARAITGSRTNVRALFDRRNG